MQQKGNIKQHYGERWGYGVLRKLQSRAALDWGGDVVRWELIVAAYSPAVSAWVTVLSWHQVVLRRLFSTPRLYIIITHRVLCMCVCVCARTHVCVLSQSLWGATNSQVTNKLAAATIAPTPVPPLYPNKPGTSSAFFPSAYISDAAHSHKFTAPNVRSEKKNFLFYKKKVQSTDFTEDNRCFPIN